MVRSLLLFLVLIFWFPFICVSFLITRTFKRIIWNFCWTGRYNRMVSKSLFFINLYLACYIKEFDNSLLPILRWLLRVYYLRTSEIRIR